MKILVDMNLSPRWTDFLAGNGIESVHWSSIGSPDAPDTTIMSYAQTHGFVVLTSDLDFGFILAISHSNKPSVIQIRTGALGPECQICVFFSHEWRKKLPGTPPASSYYDIASFLFLLKMEFV
jgi:predicted nuclease of predicted toxin-antitoxin system